MAEIDISDGQLQSERRGSERKKLIVDVQFDGGDGTGIASVRDIGSGGLYMATTAVLDRGMPIMMSMGIGDRTMNIKGVVVYSDPGHGVGVRFRDLGVDEEKFLTGELALS